MNDDRFQRQMDFILEQHARFDEKMLDLEERQRQNTEDITRLVGAVMNLTLHSQDQDQRITALVEHIDELAAAGKETDARLNTLISVVERFFSNGGKK